MTLKISEVKPDYVSGQNVRNVQCLMANENVKFYTVEGSES